MTTYARIVSGYALDCQSAASATQLVARYHPVWLAANPFTVVPDGTLHGAKDNGNGTFTNPPIATPLTKDLTLTKKEARALAVEVFGGAGAGSAKLQGYIDIAAASTATTAGAQNTRFALRAYDSDGSFTKDEASSIMTGLNFASGDKAAVLAAWPFIVV